MTLRYSTRLISILLLLFLVKHFSCGGTDEPVNEQKIVRKTSMRRIQPVETEEEKLSDNLESRTSAAGKCG